MSLQLGITKDGQPVLMSEEAHRLSTYLVGTSRHGKSHVMTGMIRHDLEVGEGLVVIDPHGTLIRDVLPWIPDERLGDVYLLDCGHPTHSFGLNLFDMGTDDDASVAEFVGVFRAVWADSWGTWMEELLSMIGWTAFYNPIFKITDVPHFLTFGKNPYRDELVANIRNPPVVEYWAEFAHWTKRDWEDRTRSTLVRIRPFITNPRLRAIVGQETTLNLEAVASGEVILLINLNESVLRDDQAVSLLGSLLVNRIINELRSRRREEPVIHLYADEVHRFTSPLFSTAFNEMGKFGLAPVTANQQLDQLNQEQRSAMIGANSLFVFRLGGEGDARVLGEKFRAEPEYPEQIVATNPWAEVRRGKGRNNPVVRDAYTRLEEAIGGRYGFGILASQTLYPSGQYLRDHQEAQAEYPAILYSEVEQFLIENRDLATENAIREAVGQFIQRSYIIQYIHPEQLHRDHLSEQILAISHRRIDPWVERFSAALIDFMQTLVVYPIWSPEWEAAQINGPKRSVTEIFNEHINQLATLPRWHAWVSIGERDGRHEYRMQTLPPEAPPPTPVIDTGPYTSPRTDVLAELDQSKAVEKVETVLTDEPRGWKLPPRKKELP